MTVTTKTYNKIKQILTIGVPALNVLIASLGGLYNFPTDLIIGTISALAIFAGVVLQILSNNYDNENKPDYGDGQEFTEKENKK